MAEVFSIAGSDELVKMLIIVCPLVFFAGFVDAVAGGGGIISLPAYLIAGLPVQFAAGSNKLANSIGTTVSAWKYIRNSKIVWRVAIVSAIGSLLGAVIGTRLALLLREEVLHAVIIAAIPLVAVFMLLKKNFGSENAAKNYSDKARTLISLCIGVMIGAYDGLIGPGTGTFLLLAFTGILGMDLLTSSGCAKLSNLASNVASMVVFVLSNKVVYIIALPAALFSIAGNYLGARLALKKGAALVRGMLFAVLALLFIKLLSDFLI